MKSLRCILGIHKPTEDKYIAGGFELGAIRPYGYEKGTALASRCARCDKIALEIREDIDYYAQFKGDPIYPIMDEKSFA